MIDNNNSGDSAPFVEVLKSWVNTPEVMGQLDERVLKKLVSGLLRASQSRSSLVRAAQVLLAEDSEVNLGFTEAQKLVRLVHRNAGDTF